MRQRPTFLRVRYATSVGWLSSARLGDYAGAKEALGRALRIFEKFFAEDHPSVQFVRRNLAELDRRL